MKRLTWRAAAALAAALPLLCVPRATGAFQAGAHGELAGRVELRQKDGQLVPAEGAVVWVEGAGTDETAAPTIISKDKRFAPRVVAVRKGGSVAFPNMDGIFHNAFSRTPGNQFDLGLYRRGESRSARLSSPGLVRVYCNIHPEMAAYVMVVDRAVHAVTGADGTFVVRGIPAGQRVVRVWHERGGQQESTLAFRAGARQQFDAVLDASAYRLLPHKNKYGKDYAPATKDGDRY